MKQFESQAMSLGPVDEFIVDDSQRMTMQGTINKVGLMALVLFATAYYSWETMMSGSSMAKALTYGGMFGGIIVGLIISFKPKTAPTLALVFAALEGLFVGGISASFEFRYPGLVLQAVGMTGAVLGAMLFGYKSGLIQVTSTFKKVVIYASMGIGIFYMISLVAHFGFNTTFSFFETENASMFSIGMSLVFAGIAELNLVLDFDFIENGTRNNMPKHFEWFGAFGLVFTIVWLYIEILRLLAKLRD